MFGFVDAPSKSSSEHWCRAECVMIVERSHLKTLKYELHVTNNAGYVGTVSEMQPKLERRIID